MRSETKSGPPNWRAILGRGWYLVLDALFPERCLGCQQEGNTLCLACRTKIRPALRQGCPICATEKGGGRTCNGCQSQTGLAGLTTLCEGDSALIRKLLRYYRTHDGRRFTGQDMTPWLQEILQRGGATLPLTYQGRPIIVVPEKQQLVGHHCHGRPARHGRPAPLAYLLQQAGYSCLDILGWQKKLSPQRFLTREERFTNVAGQMRAISSPTDCQLTPATPVLVFDDVFTTGATLREAAAALQAAGWQHIWGLVLYREW